MTTYISQPFWLAQGAGYTVGRYDTLREALTEIKARRAEGDKSIYGVYFYSATMRKWVQIEEYRPSDTFGNLARPDQYRVLCRLDDGKWQAITGEDFTNVFAARNHAKRAAEFVGRAYRVDWWTDAAQQWDTVYVYDPKQEGENDLKDLSEHLVVIGATLEERVEQEEKENGVISRFLDSLPDTPGKVASRSHFAMRQQAHERRVKALAAVKEAMREATEQR